MDDIIFHVWRKKQDVLQAVTNVVSKLKSVAQEAKFKSSRTEGGKDGHMLMYTHNIHLTGGTPLPNAPRPQHKRHINNGWHSGLVPSLGSRQDIHSTRVRTQVVRLWLAQQPQHARGVTRTQSDTNHIMVAEQSSVPEGPHAQPQHIIPPRPTTLMCKTGDLWRLRQTVRLRSPLLAPGGVVFSTSTQTHNQTRHPRLRAVSSGTRRVRESPHSHHLNSTRGVVEDLSKSSRCVPL